MYKYLLNLTFLMCLDMFCNTSVAYTIEINKNPVEINKYPSPVLVSPLLQHQQDSKYQGKIGINNFQPRKTMPAAPPFQLDLGPNTPHRLWCQSRYQDYRLNDNSFKNQSGVRQNCTSPYEQ